MLVLTIILKTIGIILLVLLLILLLVLFLPLEYSLELKYNESLNIKASISILKGFLGARTFTEEDTICFSINIAGITAVKKNIKELINKTKEKDKTAAKKSRSKFSIRNLTSDGFIRDILMYLKDILNIIKPKVFHLNGSFGFEDPSLTGLLCAVLPSIQLLTQNCNINYTPVFDDRSAEIYLYVYGNLFPFSAIFKTLRFLFKNGRIKLFFKKAET